MNFVAIDVETANPDLSTICQIGLAIFDDGKLVDEWMTLVDPEDDFDPIHSGVHGLTAKHVEGQPKLPEVADRLRTSLEGRVTVSHMAFDRLAVDRAFAKYELQAVATRWLDSAKVARRAWPDVRQRGYGLADMCRRLGHSFLHHDALEDAKAAGVVLVSAIRDTGTSLDQWLERAHERILPSNDVALEGNPEGELFGEVMVFTGALEMKRSEASGLAASAGCRVEPGVTKRTTIVVVGDQDLKKLAGHSKSSKHRKAELLVEQGQPIRILRESDFQALLRLD